jgi:hypothetical protein
LKDTRWSEELIARDHGRVNHVHLRKVVRHPSCDSAVIFLYPPTCSSQLLRHPTLFIHVSDGVGCCLATPPSLVVELASLTRGATAVTVHRHCRC